LEREHLIVDALYKMGAVIGAPNGREALPGKKALN